jgi:hypothetical protein
MSTAERYLQMNCSCGAEWIDDRLEPTATCPWCDLKLSWDQLADSDRMGVLGPGRIDMSPEHFRQIMTNCSFIETKLSSARGHYDAAIWTYLHSAGREIFEITIEVTSFKTEERLRSITLSLRLTGNPVLFTSILTAEQLVFVLAAIAHSLETVSDDRTPLAEGIFCGHPLEAA